MIPAGEPLQKDGFRSGDPAGGIVKHFLFLFALTLFLAVSQAWGHGTEGSISKDTGILIFAAYDDAEPMSYAEVEIHGPNSTVPFQKGRTDRNGNFMFQPDSPGQWQVVVRDGMGHQLSLNYQEMKRRDSHKSGLAAENSAEPQATPSPRFPKSMGAVTGLSIIFGLCSGIWAWKTRQRFKIR